MDKKTLISTKYENLYHYELDGVFHHFVRFSYNGKQIKKKISVGLSHKNAFKRAIEVINSFIHTIESRPVDTFGVFFSRMVNKKRAYLNKQYYYIATKTYDKHLFTFNDVKLVNIDLDMLQDLINEKLLSLKTSSVYQIQRLIIDIYAMQDVLPNLGNAIVLPKYDSEVQFDIDIEDARRLYQVILEYPDPIYRSIFMFGLYGRRKAEIAYLRWSDLDLKNKRYYIRPEHNKVRRHAIYKLTDIHIETIGEIEEKADYVHLNEKGNPLYYFRKRWVKLLTDNELPYMRFHDLRHLLGGIAVNAGYSLEQIGKALGHKSIQTTKRYSRMKEETASLVVDGVHKLLK